MVGDGGPAVGQGSCGPAHGMASDECGEFVVRVTTASGELFGSLDIREIVAVRQRGMLLQRELGVNADEERMVGRQTPLGLAQPVCRRWVAEYRDPGGPDTCWLGQRRAGVHDRIIKRFGLGIDLFQHGLRTRVGRGRQRQT